MEANGSFDIIAESDPRVESYVEKKMAIDSYNNSLECSGAILCGSIFDRTAKPAGTMGANTAAHHMPYLNGTPDLCQ